MRDPGECEVSSRSFLLTGIITSASLAGLDLTDYLLLSVLVTKTRTMLPKIIIGFGNRCELALWMAGGSRSLGLLQRLLPALEVDFRG